MLKCNDFEMFHNGDLDINVSWLTWHVCHPTKQMYIYIKIIKFYMNLMTFWNKWTGSLWFLNQFNWFFTEAKPILGTFHEGFMSSQFQSFTNTSCYSMKGHNYTQLGCPCMHKIVIGFDHYNRNWSKGNVHNISNNSFRPSDEICVSELCQHWVRYVLVT